MRRALGVVSCLPVALLAAAVANAGCSSSGTGGSGGAGESGSGGQTATPPVGGAPEGWVLAWSDEFEGPDGSEPDPVRWTILEGGHGWGNEERQYYTKNPENVRVEGGALVITALAAEPGAHDCWYGPCLYTSARLSTKGKLQRQYGRIEARIHIPYGQGLWPAFWMLGANIDQVGWPQCGEIDVMENVGKEPATVYGTLHGPGYSAGAALSSPYSIAGGKFADEPHDFAVEWEEGVVRFYVDGKLYSTRTAADLPAGAPWVFEAPFFLLLNVAVGGLWPGDPDASTTFPQTMRVEHVRVYERP